MKNIFTAMIALLVSISQISCSSQIDPLANNPQKIWDKSIVFNERNILKSIFITPDNNFTIIGSVNISAENTPTANQNMDFWFAKVNGFGKTVWKKTYGGNSNEYVQSSIKTNDGGFVIVGYSNSNKSGDKTENSKGNSDYWVVKLNAEGQKEWDKTLGGNNNDFAQSIINTNDGGFIVAGHSDSEISGDKSESSRGSLDYWIVKLNSKGEKIWDKTFGGNGIDEVVSIISDQNGNYVILGKSSSAISGDKTEALFGVGDFWVMKINSEGNKIWNKVFGGNESDNPVGIISDPDGNLIMTGLSFSQISGNKTARNKGYTDFWVLKVNSMGQMLWDRTFGGNVFNYPQSIISTPTGDIVIAGTSQSDISADKTEKNRGESDYWIVQINTNGKKIWDKTLGGSRSDYSQSLSNTDDGNLLVGGFSESGISGDKTEKTLSRRDLWLVKLKSQ